MYRCMTYKGSDVLVSENVLVHDSRWECDLWKFLGVNSEKYFKFQQTFVECSVTMKHQMMKLRFDVLVSSVLVMSRLHQNLWDIYPTWVMTHKLCCKLLGGARQPIYFCRFCWVHVILLFHVLCFSSPLSIVWHQFCFLQLLLWSSSANFHPTWQESSLYCLLP